MKKRKIFICLKMIIILLCAISLFFMYHSYNNISKNIRFQSQFQWEISPPIFPTPLLTIDIETEIEDYIFQDIYERLYIFSHLLPSHSFTHIDEMNYYELIANCTFITQPIGNSSQFDGVTSYLEERGLHPNIASSGRTVNHIEEAMNYFFEDEINVNIDLFIHTDAEHKRFVGYDTDYNLFFIQPSTFPKNIPCIMDIKHNNTRDDLEVTVAYVSSFYGDIFTHDHKKIIGDTTATRELYHADLQYYLETEATKYKIVFNKSSLKIISFEIL